MTDPQFKMTLDDRELKKYMTMVYNRLKDLRGFFVSIIPILHGSIISNFRHGGRPRKWAPLKESTVQGRIKEKTWPGFAGGQPILLRYGTLFRSIGTVRNITPKTLEYGTNLAKAWGLQNGRGEIKGVASIPATQRTRNGKTYNVKAHTRSFRFGPMKARPFVLFQKDDIKRILSYAAAFAFQPDQAKKITAGVNTSDTVGGGI